jgi:hypothetical protein
MSATEDDPIFAIIAEHKAAIDAWVNGADDDDEANTKALDRQEETFDRLFMVAPTTVGRRGVAHTPRRAGTSRRQVHRRQYRRIL